MIHCTFSRRNANLKTTKYTNNNHKKTNNVNFYANNCFKTITNKNYSILMYILHLQHRELHLKIKLHQKS